MIKGISIGEYRSIGARQYIWPLGKINLFVGPNNSGKSNVLRFVNENLAQLANSLRTGNRNAKLDSRPHVRRGKPSEGSICVAMPLEAMMKAVETTTSDPRNILSVIHNHLAPNDLLWIDEQWPNKGLIESAVHWGDSSVWRALWLQATKQSGGGLIEHWIPETLKLLRRLIPSEITVYAIPIERQANNASEDKETSGTTTFLGGNGIIRSLAAMQNPGHTAFIEDRARFSAIQEFVRTVTDDASAEISVPHKQDEILVQLKGQAFLPLASLGSGIEQVVLHAVAATTAIDAVVTFEEPELHLHPVLQRQLMTYLAHTSNQYFISTHSAHLIDAMHSDVFHVRLVDGETVIEKAQTDAQRYKICSDLGYRPSDIVQANCVIWVEGPSDRVYIRHWLQAVDSHLKENVHYSIMFYGGKLLSHLSAGESHTVDDGLNDLIQLRLLNRQVAVVIDSDRKKAADGLRATKVRVTEEIQKSGGLVWVSEGREIENYISKRILSAAVETVAPGRGAAAKSGQFAKVLPTATLKSKVTVDKVATAQAVAEQAADLTVLDLKQRVQDLAAFIRRANGLPLIQYS